MASWVTRGGAVLTTTEPELTTVTHTVVNGEIMFQAT
jgi:hypothetical protein